MVEIHAPTRRALLLRYVPQRLAQRRRRKPGREKPPLMRRAKRSEAALFLLQPARDAAVSGPVSARGLCNLGITKSARRVQAAHRPSAFWGTGWHSTNCC
jgi:hypothetical protein